MNDMSILSPKNIIKKPSGLGRAEGERRCNVFVLKVLRGYLAEDARVELAHPFGWRFSKPLWLPFHQSSVIWQRIMESNHHRGIATAGQGSNLVTYRYVLSSKFGWGCWIRTNAYKDQSLGPYRLAKPQLR